MTSPQIQRSGVTAGRPRLLPGWRRGVRRSERAHPKKMSPSALLKSDTLKTTLRMICLVLVAAVCPRPASGQMVLEAWVQSYHKPGSYDNIPIALAVAGNGNVVVTGTSADDFGVNSWLTVAWSSSGNFLWTQSYHGPVEFTDGQPNAVVADAIGNTYVTGVILAAGTANQDYLTLKYSSDGEPLWSRTYDGTASGNDGATAIVMDADGNVIVTGLSTGKSGLSNFFDCVTIKYSPDGVPLWVNRYNGPGNNEDGPVDVAVNAAGNVLVTGVSQTQEGDFDYLTLAISREGEELWARQYNGPSNSDDYGKALAMDRDGKVFVTGFSDSGGSTSIAEYATVAYSPAGDLLWANRYHANELQHPFYNLASDVAVDDASNVFVTGGAGGGPGGGMATLKYSNAGTQLWTRIYKGPSIFGFNDDGRAVAIDGSGNVIVTGRSYAGNSDAGDFATLAYSNAGSPLWTKRYNGPANGDDTPMNRKSLGLGLDGSVYVTGASDQDPSEGQQYQFVVVKYAPPIFRRSDADQSGTIDITDAVNLINSLFLGSSILLACEDAADSDDSGFLDIADAVYTLSWLFTGGDNPPAPGPAACGPDPTDDGLADCVYDPEKC